MTEIGVSSGNGVIPPLSKPVVVGVAKTKNAESVAGLFYFNELTNFKNKYTLTFDDGPNLMPCTYIDTAGVKQTKTVSERVLDILKENNQKAVFFICGKNLVDHQGVVLAKAKTILERMIAEGHVLANHTFHHDNLKTGKYNDGKNDVSEIMAEIELNERTVNKVLGYDYEMTYFRPPYAEGGRTASVDEALRLLHKDLIILQLDSFDWRVDNKNWSITDSLAHIKNKLINNSFTGGTVLMHELKQTIEMLPSVIELFNTSKNLQGAYHSIDMDNLFFLKYPVDAGLNL